MTRTHGKTVLLAMTLAVVLLAGAFAAIGSACIAPLGCGCACSACTAACSNAVDACQSSLNESLSSFLPTVEPMWDGPGSIKSTPEPTATPVPATEEPTAEALPVTTPDPSVSLDGQKPAVISGVRQPRVKLRGDGTDTVTVLILMNGSDLESEYQEATADIAEMVRPVKTERVNILLETVGTKKWSPRFGISAHHAQRWLVRNNGLSLVDNSLAQLDTTVPETLSDFIRWGAENYPADRYILILWDHGGGPVYGFGFDEYQPYSSTLTIDEIQFALREGGVYFDLIGMDSCLMSSLEVCCALYEYCDYTLLSEDFEPGCGWSYTGWIDALYRNPALSTPELCKIAINDTVRYCEQHLAEDDGVTLALMDQSYMKLLYTAWVEFAYANEDALLNANYSQLRLSTGRAHPILGNIGDWFSGNSASLEDYSVTDILSVAQNIDSDESAALVAALKQAIVYFGATSDKPTLTGLSVTLPYGDASFYNDLKRVFHNAGFDVEYVAWLERFTAVETSSDNYFDFGGWSDLWNGWNDTNSGFDWSTWFYDDETDDDPWANDDWFSWFFGS